MCVLPDNVETSILDGDSDELHHSFALTAAQRADLVGPALRIVILLAAQALDRAIDPHSILQRTVSEHGRISAFAYSQQKAMQGARTSATAARSRLSCVPLLCVPRLFLCVQAADSPTVCL